MINKKKSQILSEVIKYALVLVVATAILIIGYRTISLVSEKSCKTELAKFEIELKDMDKAIRFDAKELQTHYVPCKIEKVYFFDLNKKVNPENFGNIPIIKDSLKTGGRNNVFLLSEMEVKHSFYAGNLEIEEPYYLCFIPKFNKISFFIEGAGESVKMTRANHEAECI